MNPWTALTRCKRSRPFFASFKFLNHSQRHLDESFIGVYGGYAARLAAFRVPSSSWSNGPGRNTDTSLLSIVSTNSSERVSPKTRLNAVLCSSRSVVGASAPASGLRSAALAAKKHFIVLEGFLRRGGAFLPSLPGLRVSVTTCLSVFNEDESSFAAHGGQAHLRCE
jgi:hypothetical protein